MTVPLRPASPARKEDEALAFITDYLVRTGHSPAIGDIAQALGVGRTRAKALVHKLATKKAIERAPGTVRAISVPGLFDALVLDRLRAEGWVVNDGDRTLDLPRACPEGHLPLLIELDHIPAIELRGNDDDGGIDTRATARGTSGAGTAETST